LQAHADISAAEAVQPTGPVTVVKAWIEMIHRYIAMGVGVLIISAVIVAWRGWLKSGRSDSRFSPLFPTLLLFFVCLQGAFGAWTVTMKLQPIIVTTHLLLGMGLLGLLTWTAARQSEHAAVNASAANLRVAATVALLLLVVQIGLGGWVSTNYAALACMDFPLCHGQALPEMDFANGFTLWRHLGMTAEGEYLPFPALTAIHWTHRSFAFAVFAIVGMVAHRALKVDGLRKTGRWVLIVLGMQVATGILTIFLNWPLALAVTHNGGAALLLLLMAMLNYKTRIPTTAAAASQAATRLSTAQLN
jgi:cytochrome c oxidase assembly protein subunit 15